MSKQIIHNKIKDRTLCLSDLDGTFDDVIKVIQQWKSDYEGFCYEGEWCKLSLDYYGYDGASELTVKYYRQETDEEFKVRLGKEQKRLIKQQQKELEQLKKLQEKYKELDIEL